VDKYLIPGLILFILLYGYKRKVALYDEFILGCEEGLKTVVKIIPAMLALVLAVEVFTGSGFLTLVGGKWADILALAIMRPISGNASLALLNHLYAVYGVDSFWGFLGSVMQGATDTTIYVLALYFGSIHIKETRYALGVGLAADVAGIIAALVVSYFFF